MNIKYSEPECTNPSLGVLLVSYSLGTLSEQDAESFEDHLLNCQACRNEMQQSLDELQTLSQNRPAVLSQLHQQGQGFETALAQLQEAQAESDQMNSVSSGSARAKAKYFRIAAILIAAAALFSVVWFGSSLFRKSDIIVFPKEQIADMQKDNLPGDASSQMESKNLLQNQNQDSMASLRRTQLADLAVVAKLPFAFTTLRSGDEEYSEQFRNAMQAYLDDNLQFAQQQLLALSKQESKKVDVWLYLGVTAYLNGNYELAERSLKQGLQLNPRVTRTQQLRWYLVNALLKQGKNVDARKLLVAIVNDRAVFVDESRELLAKINQVVKQY
jgi:TolA-binding protein